MPFNTFYVHSERRNFPSEQVLSDEKTFMRKEARAGTSLLSMVVVIRTENDCSAVKGRTFPPLFSLRWAEILQ